MRGFWKKEGFLWVIYTLVTIGVSVQKYALGTLSHGYTAYENYRIFKTSYGQLIAGVNPYVLIPGGPWDVFKYSPAFALAMAPFSGLPDWLGLPLWNLLNALPLLFAILHLPILTQRQRIFCAWFILPELLVSLQNTQSNGLTAALILLVFLAFERQRPAQAAGWTMGAAFIKVFGIFAAVPALLYPRKLPFAGWLLLWSAILTCIPLVVLWPEQLVAVYRWWAALLVADQSVSLGLSVQGWLQSWFGWEPSKSLVTLAGLAVLVISILAVRQIAGQDVRYRILAWASLLLWVVIFNHKAESPTYVIALCGVALWWCGADKKPWEHGLLWTAFVFASLTPTDIFPRYLREHFVQPYVLKAIPCIVVWVAISVRLIRDGRVKKLIMVDEGL